MYVKRININIARSYIMRHPVWRIARCNVDAYLRTPDFCIVCYMKILYFYSVGYIQSYVNVYICK